MRIWVDNDNMVRGLEEGLGVERADAVWAVAENWSADSQEVESSWRVQLGVGADGDLWGAMDLLLERIVTNGRQVGGALGEGTRRQEDEDEDDEQAPERECQG